MFEKQMKNLDWYDMILTKLAVLTLTLFLITASSAISNLVQSIHWGWFLGIGILAAIRPVKRFYF